SSKVLGCVAEDRSWTCQGIQSGFNKCVVWVARLNPAYQNIAVKQVPSTSHLAATLVEALSAERARRQIWQLVRTFCDCVEHRMELFNGPIAGRLPVERNRVLPLDRGVLLSM